MDTAVTENLLVCSVHFYRTARGQICPGKSPVDLVVPQLGGLHHSGHLQMAVEALLEHKCVLIAPLGGCEKI